MKRPENEKGFSLMEVTIALGVVTLIMGIAFTLLNRSQIIYRYEEGYAEAARNGRFAIARLEEIIRSAGTNPTGKTTVNWLTFVDFGGGDSGTSLRLKSDLNGDGATTSTLSSNTDVIVASEDVTLQLDTSTNTLVMIDNNVPVDSTRRRIPIAENIRSLSFSDSDTTNHSRKEVNINLWAVPSGVLPSDPRYRQVNFKSIIRLRNR